MKLSRELLKQIDPYSGFLLLISIWRPNPDDPDPEMPGLKQQTLIFVPVKPEVTKKEGGWEFDFSRTERMIRMFLDEGFTYIELPHIAGHDRRKEAVARFVVYVDDKPVPGTSHEAYEYLASTFPRGLTCSDATAGTTG